MESELERVASFHEWSNDTISPLELSKAGFYHVGGKMSSRVVCFSCELTIDNWEGVSSSPYDEHKLRSPQCPLVNPAKPASRQNIPLSSSSEITLNHIANGLKEPQPESNAQLNRPDSFNNGISNVSKDYKPVTIGIEPTNPRTKRQPGFYADGDGGLQTPPCHHCENELPSFQHPSLRDDPEPEFASTRSEVLRASNFSKSTASNNMVSESERLLTYRSYPYSYPDIRDMAKTGFYYLNKGDKTKCAFCGIVLSRWEPDDSPEGEHRRHSPNCPFLSGYDVGNIPRGEQPYERSSLFQQPNPSSYQRMEPDSVNRNTDSSTENSLYASSHTVPRPSPLRAGVRYRVEPREIKARLDTPLIRLVLGMGYTREVLSKVIEERLRTTGNDFEKAQSVLDAIFALEERQNEQKRRELQSHALATPIVPPVVPEVAVAASCDDSHNSHASVPSCTDSINEARPSSVSLCPDTASKTSKSKKKKNRSKSKTGQKANASGQKEDSLGQKDNGPCQKSEQSDLKADGSEQKVAAVTKDPVNGASIESEKMKHFTTDEMARLIAENEAMLEQRQCKVCLDTDVCIVFLPCSHLVTCEKCAKKLDLCPVCREHVKATVHIYMP